MDIIKIDYLKEQSNKLHLSAIKENALGNYKKRNELRKIRDTLDVIINNDL